MRCHVVQSGDRLELHSPNFALHVNIGAALRARALENRPGGRTITLGDGSELAVDVDRTAHRISIAGWRTGTSDGTELDDDTGIQAGFHRRDFRDQAWRSVLNPALARGADRGQGCQWTRTHFLLPRVYAEEAITLVLGGFGLFDYRTMRVFLNGHEIGVRHALRRWNEPGSFDFGRGSSAYQYLRFDQDNVLALQLEDNFARPPQFDELDPLHSRHFYREVWPAQFEQYIVVGQPFETPRFHVADVQVEAEGEQGRVACVLQATDGSLAANIRYCWDTEHPVIRRFTQIRNTGGEPLRLLNVRLGSYSTNSNVSDGEQGFPVYLDEHVWMGLAHPSGWATGLDGTVRLRQYPAALLAPGEAYDCMEVVFGVTRPGEARSGFRNHIAGRMRRVLRGRDKALAIFEGLGSWDYDPAAEAGHASDSVSQEASDERLLPNLRAMVQGQAEAGYHFDYYAIEMWADYYGDWTRPDPIRFPDGFKHINAELAKIGTAPGLWMDVCSGNWSIGGNPLVPRSYQHDPGYPPSIATLCLAAEPVRTLYRMGLRHHILENGVRLLKQDGPYPLCYNPGHDHLPGVYSTEATQNVIVEALGAWDAICPDVFLMLYWGYRSPWWLLHADTVFEPGFHIEAGNPGGSPTLYVRDSVTQGLDQGQWWCSEIPPLGKDSLGVWLSHWKWNSSIGTERWQEGFVMDMGRGSLLAQPWSDGPWLSPPERKQIAEFIALLRARPECFRNSRFVLGNPWRDEPYGYCCTDGTRAFLALHNCTWSDAQLQLELNEAWGLPDAGEWDLYRWYPAPARLTVEGTPATGTVTLAARPFSVQLIEVVPAGMEPSLSRQFAEEGLPRSFAEPSCEVAVQVDHREGLEPAHLPREDERQKDGSLPPKHIVRLRGEVPASSTGGTLAVTVELRRGSAAFLVDDIGKDFAAQGTLSGRHVACVPVVRNRTFAIPWQAWRITIGAAPQPREVEMIITALIPEDVVAQYHAYFIPDV